MSDGDIVHFSDVFGMPGEWVAVELVAPTHTAELGARSGSPMAVPELVAEELSPGARTAWGMGDGWPAFGTRIAAVAALLGGSVDLQSFRREGWGEERHEARYKGEVVEV